MIRRRLFLLCVLMLLALLAFRNDDPVFINRESGFWEYNETGQNSNLMGLLAFYASVVPEMDYVPLMGEDGPSNREEGIAARCQGAKDAGWKSVENRCDRYCLVDDLQDRGYNVLIREKTNSL